MTEQELFEIEKRAIAATSPPWAIGIVDPDLDPVEWFRANLSFSELTDIWSVWCPEHPQTKGDHPRPDHAVTCAITGNGPDSESNARFIADARTDMLKLIAEVRSLWTERLEW